MKGRGYLIYGQRHRSRLADTARRRSDRQIGRAFLDFAATAPCKSQQDNHRGHHPQLCP